MTRLLAFFCLVFAFAGVRCEKDPEADFRKLPKLFHLDDYERCLERKDGIYCLGLFDVYSDVEPNPIYDIIKEKSQDVTLYNRSYLHRGYCLPTRCPSHEANASARFERCVDAWAREHSLRARLRTLHYCRAHGQPRPREPDTNDLPHRLVLYFVYTVLVMAVVGTVYDFYFAKKGSKNSLLMSFSIRSNWNTLTSDHQDVDPRLRELDVFYMMRFFMTLMFIQCHVCILTAVMYQYNPRYLDKVFSNFYVTRYAAGMSATPIFILISSFLTTYNLLVLSTKINFSLKFIPLLVLKRVVRIYPVYLLINGFAATWYKSFGDGPLWPVLVANESEICKKKFWVITAFLQNFIYKKELCLVQTWIIAVDMQLHLLTLFLTLVLMKHRQHAIKILSVLLIASVALIAYHAFEYDLVSTYMYTTPEVYRNVFLGADSFFDLYINPMNGLITALAGILVAFIHMDHQERDIKMSRSKVLVFLHYMCLIILEVWYIMVYLYFKHFDRWTQNLLVVVERVLFGIVLSFLLYSLINHKGYFNRISSWRPLRIPTRLSLSVSMVHWCITVLMFADRWALHDTTSLRIATDIIAVHVLSHIVALPLTLLVEYPMQKFLDGLIKKSGQQSMASLKKTS